MTNVLKENLNRIYQSKSGWKVHLHRKIIKASRDQTFIKKYVGFYRCLQQQKLPKIFSMIYIQKVWKGFRHGQKI